MNSATPSFPAEWWRERCVELLVDEDWYQLYKTAMAWRGDGGAYTPEAWLMDVCSALLHRQPKIAVHCCDMALGSWVERPEDRAVLHYVRGLLVADHVGDPKTATIDFERAVDGPAWLQPAVNTHGERVRQLAEVSRIRKPRVQQAPAYGLRSMSSLPPMPDRLTEDGAIPGLWNDAMVLINPND